MGMMILDVKPRDVQVTMEMSAVELRGILDFIQKAEPLYSKVFGDQERLGHLFVRDQFAPVLTQLLRDIKQ